MTEALHAARDEAIAAALKESRPGDIVTIHAEDCTITQTRDRVTNPCNCTPMRLVVGATA